MYEYFYYIIYKSKSRTAISYVCNAIAQAQPYNLA